MVDKTGIEWADATWNPVVGCSVVSPGCTNCYAMRVAARLARMGGKASEKYMRLTRASKSGPVWTGAVRLDQEALQQPIRWRRPRRIFVNSMSDLFHEALPDTAIDWVMMAMALAPHHQFIVLTKRAALMRDYISGAASRLQDRLAWEQRHRIDLPYANALARWPGTLAWPLPNLTLGVSIEDQARADERVPLLLDTPAATRIVSAEPLLGPIRLDRIEESVDTFADCGGHPDPAWPADSQDAIWLDALRGRMDAETRNPQGVRLGGCDVGLEHMGGKLDGVIVGGESGPGARPMHPDWARSLRDQCQSAGVPFFFKQWGEWAPQIGAIDGWTIDDDPEISRFAHREWDGKQWGEEFHPAWFDFNDGNYDEDHCVSRIGKRRAGRMLDGRTWDEMPVVPR